MALEQCAQLVYRLLRRGMGHVYDHALGCLAFGSRPVYQVRFRLLHPAHLQQIRVDHLQRVRHVQQERCILRESTPRHALFGIAFRMFGRWIVFETVGRVLAAVHAHQTGQQGQDVVRLVLVDGLGQVKLVEAAEIRARLYSAVFDEVFDLVDFPSSLWVNRVSVTIMRNRSIMVRPRMNSSYLASSSAMER